jgi:hypothetical protein
VNEAIRRLDALETGELVLICECDDHGCFAALSIAAIEFNRVCAEPDLFVVLPGHELTAETRVIEVARGYDIVGPAIAGDTESDSERGTTTRWSGDRGADTGRAV